MQRRWILSAAMHRVGLRRLYSVPCNVAGHPRMQIMSPENAVPQTLCSDFLKFLQTIQVLTFGVTRHNSCLHLPSVEMLGYFPALLGSHTCLMRTSLPLE